MKKSYIASIVIACFMCMTLIVGVVVVRVSDNALNDSTIREVENYDNSNYITDIYNANRQSVVSIINLRVISLNDFFGHNLGEQEITQGSGSGYVYKEEGGYYYVITNYHVVNGSDSLQVIIDNEKTGEPEIVDAEFIGASRNEDVALVRFKSNLDINPVKLGDSDKIVPGEPVVAMGSPYGAEFQGTITSGIVSATKRELMGDDGESHTYIQTDAAINSGNSGGPLFNAQGQVIGMNTLKISDGTTDNIAFAIPINTVIEIILQIEAAYNENIK